MREYDFMLSCMRTTIDMPDDLLIEAKIRAAERRITLRALITVALRAELGRMRKPKRRGNLKIVTVEGGLQGGPDLTDREAMHQWLEA